MIIGPDELLKLVKDKKLVENLCERELKNPEGAGFDIRMGEVYSISGSGMLGIEERETPKENLVAKYNSEKRSFITLNRGDYFLIKTIEKVNLPKNICAHVFTRSTLFRSGIVLFATQVCPGYSGNLVFALSNLSSTKMKIELGSRVAHLQFFPVKGGGKVYRGQWSGGRVSTQRREKQV